MKVTFSTKCPCCGAQVALELNNPAAAAVPVTIVPVGVTAAAAAQTWSAPTNVIVGQPAPAAGVPLFEGTVIWGEPKR